MTAISSVNPAAYYPQSYAPTHTQASAPVAPSAYGQADYYQPQYHQQPYGAPAAQAEKPYSIINKQDLMLGAAGAVGGFFLAGMVGLTGPIGALILGIALLGISAAARGVKHMSQKKQQQQQLQQQAVHPGFQQPYHQPQHYAGPAYSQQQTSFAPQQQGAAYQYPARQAAPPMMQQPYQQGYPQPGHPGYPPQQQQPGFWAKLLRWL